MDHHASASTGGAAEQKTTIRPRLLRLRAAIPEHIIPTSGALVGTFVVTGLLGFIYWLVAARFFSVGDVGFAAAAISAMMFVSIVAMAGIGTLIIREAPNHRDRERALIGTGVVGTGSVGLVLGLAFALVVPQIAVTFRPLLYPQNALAFTLGVGLTTGVLVLDQALSGLLRGRVALIRGTIFSVVKLSALLVAGVWFGYHSGMLIFATWILGDAVSILLLGLYAVRHKTVHAWLPRQWRLLRRLLPHAFGHHLVNVGLLAPSWATPILVTAILSAELNASFFVAQVLTAPGLFIPGALAFSLFAVAVRSPGMLPHQIRTTLQLSFGVAAIAAVGVILFGRPVLSLFGPTYVEQGGVALVALTLIMFPLTVKVHFANLRRIQGRVLSGSVYILGGAALELGLAAVGALMAGIEGVAYGVLIATTVEAVVMAPTVIAALRPKAFERTAAPGDR